MQRSFRSSRGMLRAVGSGVGVVQESISISRPKPTSTTLSKSSSNARSSSSVSTPPVLSTSSAHGWHLSPCFIDEDDDWEWEAIQEEEVENKEEDLDQYFFFGPVPSRNEVENAVSAIQQVLLPVVSPQFSDDGSSSNLNNIGATNEMANSIDTTRWISSDESKSDWIEPALYLYDSGARQYDNVLDAFRLLQINPSVQRMVISLSSDKAVWNAVMNNEVVQEVRESFYAAHDAVEKDQDYPLSSGESPAAVRFLRWMLNNTKAKMMELINKISKIAEELFRGPEKEKAMDGFEGTLASTFMLSVIVLLVIVVTRSRSA